MHKFDPANMKRLLSPERRKMLPPEEVLAALGIAEGQIVADLGCGAGFFAVPAARAVAPAGMVYAVDISPEMLAYAKDYAEKEGIGNIEWIKSEENRIDGVPAAAVDAALLANVLHELESPADFLAEIKRILKPEGRLWIVEWLKEPTSMGPPVTERLSEKETEALLNNNGFSVKKILPFKAHYGIVAGQNRSRKSEVGSQIV